MPFNIKVLFVCLFLSVFFSNTPVFAHDDASTIPSQRYQSLKNELAEIRKTEGAYTMELFESNNPKTWQALNRKQKKQRAHYHEVKKLFWFWSQVYHLQKELLARYAHFYPDAAIVQKIGLERESGELALSLIKGIGRLKKQYKMTSFPIVHNLLMEVKIRKRGACKHWAEDLLKIIESVDRNYFTAYWGEAHPGTILEHNVAVLVPKGVDFKEGLLVDPWRMAGKPFWIVVKEDHLDWQAWAGYDPR